ncbi:MAG: polysaccharide pyruvyl transferase family protein [Chthoniobacter sp.]|nr:polysaccharide pyruvyl transferase family protein [Chthoniobacter sp.]
MLINMFDTAIESDNLGDHFIMDAVWEAVRPLFSDTTFVRTPTHRKTTRSERRAGRLADFSIVGGTNILKSHMLVRGNWRITPLDYLNWRNVVLLGVGWQQYGGEADVLTRLFFRSVLSKTKLHSVRDLHTYENLRRHVPNVIYTACPTMWMLDQRRCQAISVRKARHAVFAVTYYRPAPEQDRRVFEILKRHYETVYVWPQQSEDLPYLREIGVTDFVPIAADVAAYDRLLDEEDVDFVGARLHGGIRALQHGRRALIIPVDNRAAEISISTALPVASRAEPEAIEWWIDNPRPTAIVLPTAAIEQWKAQFA